MDRSIDGRVVTGCCCRILCCRVLTLCSTSAHRTSLPPTRRRTPGAPTPTTPVSPPPYHRRPRARPTTRLRIRTGRRTPPPPGVRTPPRRRSCRLRGEETPGPRPRFARTAAARPRPRPVAASGWPGSWRRHTPPPSRPPASPSSRWVCRRLPCPPRLATANPRRRLVLTTRYNLRYVVLLVLVFHKLRPLWLPSVL